MEKILVIEDEALIARELKGRLNKMGWDVVGVAYGAEGVELARQTKPDLLLSDIHLKEGLSGIDLALEIQRENDPPVIFLTAYSDEDTVNKAKQASPFGYIIKPAETRELQINIKMALYKFRIEKELKETQQLLETALTCIGSALIFVGKSVTADEVLPFLLYRTASTVPLIASPPLASKVIVNTAIDNVAVL